MLTKPTDFAELTEISTARRCHFTHLHKWTRQRSVRKNTQITQGSVYLSGNNMSQIISPTAAVLGKFNVVYKNI